MSRRRVVSYVVTTLDDVMCELLTVAAHRDDEVVRAHLREHDVEDFARTIARLHDELAVCRAAVKKGELGGSRAV